MKRLSGPTNYGVYERRKENVRCVLCNRQLLSVSRTPKLHTHYVIAVGVTFDIRKLAEISVTAGVSMSCHLRSL